MIPLFSLWLPILLSSAAVFIVSSVIHMVLPYHRKNFAPVPDEDGVMDALRKFKLAPGEYFFPHAGSPKAMSSPEFLQKYEKGPVAFFTVLPSGKPSMGGSLVLWFLYSVVIGIFVAYVTSRALEPGAEYRTVVRFAGVTAFLSYAVGLWQNSIWFKRKWSTTFKNTFDGLVYAGVTAGFFGWLWPAA